MMKATRIMIANFHQISERIRILLRIRIAPGTKKIPMLSMKYWPTSDIPSVLIRPVKRKTKSRIKPINEPGKGKLINESKYERRLPIRAKMMMILLFNYQTKKSFSFLLAMHMLPEQFKTE